MKISFDKSSPSGLGTYVSWSRLRPHIEEAIDLKPTEKIVQINVDENGLSVSLDHIKPPVGTPL